MLFFVVLYMYIREVGDFKMKLLNKKSIKYTKILILEGYELKAVKEDSLVYMNNERDMKIVFNNQNLRSNIAEQFLNNINIQKNPVGQAQLKNEVVKLVEIGAINQKMAIDEFGKYVKNDRNMDKEGMQA